MCCYLQVTYALNLNAKPTVGFYPTNVHGLTLGATPSGDVAGVVVGQDLVRGRQGGELDIVVESSFRGQAQESNVPPEGDANISSCQGEIRFITAHCHMYGGAVAVVI